MRTYAEGACYLFVRYETQRQQKSHERNKRKLILPDAIFLHFILTLLLIKQLCKPNNPMFQFLLEHKETKQYKFHYKPNY